MVKPSCTTKSERIRNELTAQTVAYHLERIRRKAETGRFNCILDVRGRDATRLMRELRGESLTVIRRENGLEIRW
jgi:hypothetical protein